MCEFTELSLINESLLQPKIEIEDGYISSMERLKDLIERIRKNFINC